MTDDSLVAILEVSAFRAHRPVFFHDLERDRVMLLSRQDEALMRWAKTTIGVRESPLGGAEALTCS